jgi:TRAP transporter TAXI family solute receptor
MTQAIATNATGPRSLRKTVIAAAAALPLSVAATGSALAANDVIIGAHEAGSTYYVIGAAVADVISKNSKYTGKMITAAGAAVWMPMMDSREVDLGVASHYEAWLARGGKKPFAKSFDVRTVVVGGGINVGLYVRKDSDIKTLADIKGKRIGSGYPGAPAIGVYALGEIANGGFGWGDMQAVPRTSLYAGQREDVTEKRLDVFYASVGSGITNELNSTIGIRFLSLDPSPAALASMRKVYPAVVTPVKAGPPGIETDMHLTYLPTYLIGHAKVSNDTIYAVTKALWEKNADLQAANPRLKGWVAAKYATVDVTVPYHDGAIKYFKEAGAWTPALEAHQAGLLAAK